MNAEQYRALVDKLEAIQQLDELKIGDINPATGKRITGGMTDSEGNLVGSGTPGVYWNAKEEPVDAPAPAPTPEPTPAPTSEPTPAPVDAPVVPDEPGKGGCDPATLEKIKYMKSFNQAFAAARQAGCETFQWCGVYRTKSPQGGKPAQQGKVDFTGQSTPLGGDKENPMSFAPNSNFGA